MWCELNLHVLSEGYLTVKQNFNYLTCMLTSLINSQLRHFAHTPHPYPEYLSDNLNFSLSITHSLLVPHIYHKISFILYLSYARIAITKGSGKRLT